MKNTRHILILYLMLTTSFSSHSQKKINTNVGSFVRPTWAGFYANKFPSTGIDTNKSPFIKGLSDRIRWSDTEPNDSIYDWSSMDNAVNAAVKGGYYYYFVLWSGPDCPQWIYTKGVRKVYTDFTASPIYPYYLDPIYSKYFHRYIDKLADHIASLSAAQRKVISFIQPAFGSTGDQQLYKGNLLDVKDSINDQQYFDFCSAAATRFYQAFSNPTLASIPFLFNIEDDSSSTPTNQLNGQQLFANWLRANHTIVLRKQQFTTAIGYQVNSEIVQDTAQRSSFYGLNGKTPDFVRGEFSKFASGGIFQENPIWNYYWTAISTVDRGLDLWEMDYNTIATGLYNEGFIFSNKYSYYKTPQTSPYAFVALRDVLDADDTNRFPIKSFNSYAKNDSNRYRLLEQRFAKYGAKIGDMNAATNLTSSTYLLNAKAMNDVGSKLIARNYSRFITQIDPNNTSVGMWRVGPVNQPYGRYARAFENSTNKNRMYFDLNNDFIPQTVGSKSVNVKIIYFDEGIGTFSFRYDSSTDHDKIAKTFTKTNRKRWIEVTITIVDAAFLNMGTKSSDFSLVNEDSEDDIFHMVEITKNAIDFSSVKNEKFQQSIIFNNTNSILCWSSLSEIDEVMVANTSGRDVVKFVNPINNSVDLNSLNNGIYICNLFKNRQLIQSLKIIKTNHD